MKLRLFIAAILLVICTGCVAYNYSDPYYSTYPYNYYYSPYYYPYGPFIYPDVFLNFHDHGHGGGFHGHRSFHGTGGGFHGNGVYRNHGGFHGQGARR